MIHAIQGYIAPDSGMTESEVQTAIDDWVAARAKWNGGNWEASVDRRNTAEDGTGDDYLRFAVRFEWSEAKDDTLQKCADKFKNKLTWFALVYHECDHDQSSRPGCSWDERWNWDDGTTPMPASVEDVVPSAPTVVNA